MNADRLHGGTTPDVRDVPLYWIKPGDAGRGDTHEVVSQFQFAPTICKLLGMEVPKTIIAAALVWINPTNSSKHGDQHDPGKDHSRSQDADLPQFLTQELPACESSHHHTDLPDGFRIINRGY